MENGGGYEQYDMLSEAGNVASEIKPTETVMSTEGMRNRDGYVWKIAILIIDGTEYSI